MTGPLCGLKRTRPNQIVRSLFTSPERSFFKPDPLRAPSNPLNYRAFYIRTKTGVVRLCQRKVEGRDGKRPKMGLSTAARGSDKWPEKPAFCGFRPVPSAGKRMSQTAKLAEGEELWSNTLFLNISIS
jgi:hypothetical protein